MPVVHHVVTLPVTKLSSFFHMFRAFFNANTIWNSTFFLVFSSVLFPSNSMGAAQVLSEVLLPSIHAVDELVYTLLVQVPFAFPFHSSGHQIRRPAFLQKTNDLFLEHAVFHYIHRFSTGHFPSFRFPLRCIR